MRVLLVAPHVLPRFRGGVEVLTEQAAEWLSRHGHTVTLAAIEDPLADRMATEVERRLSGCVVQRLRFRAEGPLALQHDDPRLRAWLDAIVREFEPDIMHLQSGYLVGTAAIKAARAHHVPIVVLLHDYWFICPRVTFLQPGLGGCLGPGPEKCTWCLFAGRRWLQWSERVSGGQVGRLGTFLLAQPWLRSVAPAVRRRVEKVAARNAAVRHSLQAADAVIAVSASLKTRIEAEAPGGRSVKLHLTGLPGTHAALRPRREQDAPLRVGFFGQLAPHKGVHVLAAAVVEAAGAGVPIELYLYGDTSPHRVYVRKLQRRLAGVRHVFVGPYLPEQVHTLMARLDVIAVPSIFPEIRPLVILEAQRAGVPVVASRIGGIADMVDSERSGLLVPPDDVSALRAALARLAFDGALLHYLSRGAPHVRTLDDAMAELVDLYRQTIAASGS